MTGLTVGYAIHQYKFDSSPADPVFKFKERALIYLAVDPDLVIIKLLIYWKKCCRKVSSWISLVGSGTCKCLMLNNAAISDFAGFILLAAEYQLY